MRFLVLSLLFSCGSAEFIKTNHNPKYSLKIPADKVQVFIKEDIGRKYEVLGMVMAIKDSNDEPSLVVKKLKEKATHLGADAIVGLRFHYRPGFFKTLAIEGQATAVSFR